MKRIFTLIFSIILLTNIAYSDEGDTTIIYSHDHTHMNWYGGWNQWSVFPDNNMSYNRVWLEYTLGCPGGGCSEWDYTTNVEILEHTGVIDSTLKSHAIFKVNGTAVDSIFISYDSIWATYFNTNTNATDSLIKDKLTILIFNDSIFPILATDTVYAYEGNYYNYYYDTSGNAVDSIYVGYDSLWYNSNFQYYKPFEIINHHEIARVITPYAGSYSSSWSFNYLFDITDYSCLLHDSVDIRLHYSGWSDGFTGTLTFKIIEGIPSRKVNKINTIYNLWCKYGEDPSIETYLPSKKFKIDEDTKEAKISVTATGHGFGGNENCAEFCAKNYYLFLNNTKEFTTLVWKDDCGLNPLFHQSGTWLYDRSNWCPGTAATINNFEITPFITPNDSLEINIDFQEFTNINNSNPGYQVSAELFQFGDKNYNNEVSIDEIIAPNKDFRFNRQNSICSRPIIVIKNNGSNNLTNLDIDYYFPGAEHNTYNWTGNLAFLEIDTIVLPTPDWSVAEVDNHIFKVEAYNPNGNTDEFLFNNKISSEFDLAKIFDNYLVLNIKTNKRPEETFYEIFDKDGNLVHSASEFEASTLYKDTLYLAPGCYEFVLYDTDKDGLSFWANNDGIGYCAFYDLVSSSLKKVISSDFGTEARFQFTYSDEVTSVKDINNSPYIFIRPNPFKDVFFVDYDNINNISSIKIIDINGKTISCRNEIENNSMKFDLSDKNKGIYFLKIITDKESFVKKIIKL